MLPILTTFALAALTAPADERPIGFLVYSSATREGGPLQQKIVPYSPREGDLVLFDDHNSTWKALYAVALTEPPNHSGYIIKKPDGSLGIFESGPDDLTRVKIMDLDSRLKNFKGTMWIRRCKRPISAERSAKVWEFAKKQEGKRYAIGRLLKQGSPLRIRGAPWEKLFGRTRYNRVSWLCSEIVVAAGTLAGLFDPKLHKANLIFPRDLLDDNTYDLSATWQPSAIWVKRPEDAPKVK